MSAPGSLAPLSFDLATDADAPALAALHSAVAGHLTREFGRGHWSSSASEQAVLRGIASSRVIVARDHGGIAGALRLATKKPWSIDPKLFQKVKKPLYLVDMAVSPARQRSGVGRQLIDQARLIGRVWPADALRLDAYDAAAGASGFYRKCGFTEVGRAEYRRVPLIYFEMLL